MAGAQAWQVTLALVRADIQGHCPSPQGLRPSQPLGLLSPSPSLFSSSRRSQQGPHRTEIQEARKVPGIDGRKRGKSQSRFRALWTNPGDGPAGLFPETGTASLLFQRRLHETGSPSSAA